MAYFASLSAFVHPIPRKRWFMPTVLQRRHLNAIYRSGKITAWSEECNGNQN